MTYQATIKIKATPALKRVQRKLDHIHRMTARRQEQKTRTYAVLKRNTLWNGAFDLVTGKFRVQLFTLPERPKSRYAPHQSAREKARRVRQMQRQRTQGLEDLPGLLAEAGVAASEQTSQITDINTPADGRIAYIINGALRVYAANSASAKSRAEKAGYVVASTTREIQNA